MKTGYGVFEKYNNGVISLPVVGNGKQFQYPIFYTKTDAIEYMNECHGFQNPIIKKVELHPSK